MAKIRRAGCHPLETVVKAVFILLIASETNANSRQFSYQPSQEKYTPPLQSREYSYFDKDRRFYMPIWYYVSPSPKIQPYKEQPKDRIIFPQEEFVPLPPRISVTDPPVCSGTTFCEDTPYYPTDLVKNRLMENKSLKNLAIVDTMVNFEQRIDVSDEAPLCISTEQVIYPKTAETVNGAWLFVAQLQQQNFTQGVRIEKCMEESKPCRVIDGFASGYETKCKQRYIYRQLAAVTKEGIISSELFRFPSSCCCAVTFKDPKRKRSLTQEEGEEENDEDTI